MLPGIFIEGISCLRRAPSLLVRPSIYWDSSTIPTIQGNDDPPQLVVTGTVPAALGKQFVLWQWSTTGGNPSSCVRCIWFFMFQVFLNISKSYSRCSLGDSVLLLPAVVPRDLPRIHAQRRPSRLTVTPVVDLDLVDEYLL